MQRCHFRYLLQFQTTKTMVMILLGVVLGLLASLFLTQFLAFERNMFITNALFVSTSDEGNRARSIFRSALEGRPWVLYQPLFFGLINPIWVLLMVPSEFSGLPYPFALSYVASSWIICRYKMKPILDAARNQVLLESGQMLARWGHTPLVEDLIQKALQSTDAQVRLGAVAALAGMGTPSCNQLLLACSEDPAPAVREAASNALGQIEAHATRVPHALNTLDSLIQQCLLYGSSTYGADAAGKSVKLDQAASMAAVDDILRTQVHLRAAFPDVFCMRCKLRGEMGKGAAWRWVYCATCKQASMLRAGVKEVVGQLGGRRHRQILENTVYFELWNASRKQSRAILVDRIEILANDKIDYAWAINSLLQMVSAYYPAQLGKIGVTIDAELALDPNTMRLLREIGPISLAPSPLAA